MLRDALTPQMVISGVVRLNRRPTKASISTDRMRHRPETTASVSATRSTWLASVGIGLLPSSESRGPFGPNINERSTVVLARENSSWTLPRLAEPPISLRSIGRRAPNAEAWP